MVVENADFQGSGDLGEEDVAEAWGEEVDVLVGAAAQAEAIIPGSHVGSIDEDIDLGEKVGDPREGRGGD